MSLTPNDPIGAFLKGGDSPILSSLQLHLLNGWKPNTLASYNSAVRKFLRFYEDSRESAFKLPATEEDIYDFCVSVGRTEFKETSHEISAKTLSKYLFGIQAWHLFHQKTYPHASKDVVRVLLRSSEYSDALRPQRPKKPAVMVHHLLALYHNLSTSTPKDQAILDCVIVAFWGMARLAELTYDKAIEDPPWINSILCGDALRPPDSTSHIILTVRGAKTAKPGIHQQILLNSQANVLCPVKAIQRRASTCTTIHESLFGYQTSGGERVNLTRSVVVARCQQIWKEHDWHSISGHSFRVGGTSLRNALGVPHEDIKSLGRWTSNCYKLYLREYTREDLVTSTSILQMLN